MPSSSTPSTPSRISRIASKPLKLAASALNRSSSPAPTAATGTSPPQSNHLDTGRTRLGAGRRLSSGNEAPHVPKAARGPRKPLEGEDPAAWIRVRVVKGDDLVAKDRGGTSDPFVSLLLPPADRQSTHHIKKTLNPVFPAESSTFDFPLYLSMAGVIGGRGLEAVLWDKDLLRKEYMGELSVPMNEWFPSGAVSLWDENLTAITRNLISTRRKHDVTGTLSFQIGFLPPKDLPLQEGLEQVRTVFTSILEQSNAVKGLGGVLGVPAYKGIGTIKLRNRRKSEQALGATSGTKASALTTAPILSSILGGHKMAPGGPARPEDDDDDVSLVDDGLSDSSSDDESESPGEDDRDEVSYSPDPMNKEDQVRHDQVHPKHHDIRLSTAESYTGLSPERRRLSDRTPSSYFDNRYATGTSGEGTTPIATPGTASGSTTPGGSRRPFFLRRSKTSMNTVTSGDSASGKPEKVKKANKGRSKKRRQDFNFDADSNRDVLGIVVMEIKSASDLPKLKSALRVTYDMDPFVVISFGKKVFRTRVIRHSLNPVWDEKLLFHVRRHESAYTMQFAVLDWDKVSGNDSVGGCVLPLEQLIADAPQPGANGLYNKGEDGKHEFKEFTLPILTEKDKAWETKHSPKLTIRAKYEPYDALRQRFWRQYITQYDVDETGTMSYTELTAMLDSLGSTLTQGTIEGFFASSGKDIEGELTIEEVILHLENAVNKPTAEKAKVAPTDLATGSHTPSMAPEPQAAGLGMTGPEQNISSPVDPDELRQKILQFVPQSGDIPGNLEPAAVEAKDVPDIRVRQASMDGKDIPVVHGRSVMVGAGGDIAGSRPVEKSTPSADPDADLDVSDDGEVDQDTSDTEVRERVINIRTCPLCHRSRLKKRSEQDIVTHLAICASSDWSRVDRIVTANYVTSSQAQRKFLTRMMNKVTIGNYRLGANSANILVQDRLTGQLQEEKMAVYVRLGIRVLYKGWRSSMEGGRARRLLKSPSIKQGVKFDDPESVADILPFIAFHNLNVDEILDPIDSFKTFNEFFYRKLKSSARPVSDPEDPYRLVSPADCRMMAFETVDEATRIWIKGREFSVARLLGPEYESTWRKYDGGGLGIFRLAPQDYHRFHSPVKGKIGKMTMIDGEYYTVNPQAIRTTLDVYGENVRKIVPVESEEFGTVMTVWVGAMMVGSIATTVAEGQVIDRADELGYFAFGGSTIVCLFEKGVLDFDEDLLNNGRASIETLVRMGMGIGRSTRRPKKA